MRLEFLVWFLFFVVGFVDGVDRGDIGSVGWKERWILFERVLKVVLVGCVFIS